MQERLRLELLRRIQRGTLSVSLLARQTGFRQSHLSNFLRNRRHLSLDAIDRILAAQQMGTADLLPGDAMPDWRVGTEIAQIPVVSYAAAMNEPHIRPSSARGQVWIAGALLQSIRERPLQPRRPWQRFVAITAAPGDSQAMDPIIQPEATVLLDRHYNSFVPYRPTRPNVYGVCQDGRLKLRYADFVLDRMVLRPHNRAFPVELIQLRPGESPGELIVGRVILTLSEH
ncbi:hypothetical protein DYQ86_13370 [Acidobacteria bacterium AB60]|nr:hypothetical protein DYQ86_13370 [Acidobacteria bacterium AB60]